VIPVSSRGTKIGKSQARHCKPERAFLASRPRRLIRRVDRYKGKPLPSWAAASAPSSARPLTRLRPASRRSKSAISTPTHERICASMRFPPAITLNSSQRPRHRVALPDIPLHLHGAPNGIDHAGKLSQESVAGILDDPASILGYLRFDQCPKVSPEPFVRALFVRSHQAEVAGHVGGEDRGREHSLVRRSAG
jgi:hypothetical protein